MPYVTWAEVAEEVQGEQRLKDMLLPRVETASVHPYFDQKLEVAEGLANSALRAAGYVTPLAAVTDALFRESLIGVLIGYLTNSSSSREQWEIDRHNAGLAYFKALAKGDYVVEGAETDTDVNDSTSLILGGGSPEPAIFDYTEGTAETLSVFADLGRGPGFGWRP
jgi:hypothetical protein